MFWQTNFPEYQGPEKIVIRRYSDFVWLRDRLFEKYKGIFIPPLPEKSAVGNDWIIHTLILFPPPFFSPLKLYFQWQWGHEHVPLHGLYLLVTDDVESGIRC